MTLESPVKVMLVKLSFSFPITCSIKAIYFTGNNFGNMSVLKTFIKAFHTLFHIQTDILCTTGPPMYNSE